MAMTSSLSMVLERGGGRSTKLQHIKIAIAIQYSNGSDTGLFLKIL